MKLHRRAWIRAGIFSLLFFQATFIGCSKSKSALELDGSQNCLESEEGCGSGSSQFTDFTNSDITKDPNASTTLTNNEASQFGTNSTVSGTQQAQCYSGLNLGYGMGNTTPYADFNTGQQNGQNQTTQNTRTACMASNMTTQSAANLGYATFQSVNSCSDAAFKILKAIKGTSTANNPLARKTAAMYYIRCSRDLVGNQSEALLWSPNNQAAFGNNQYYLNDFLRRYYSAW